MISKTFRNTLLGTLTLSLASFPQIAVAQKNPTRDSAPQAKSGQITKNPIVTKEVAPTFPAQALEARMEADVVLNLNIAPDGTTESASITSSEVRSERGDTFTGNTDFGFESAALIAGSQLVFSPAESDGTPVAVSVSYTYRFTLPVQIPSVVNNADILGNSPIPFVHAKQQPAVLNFEGRFVERGTRKNLSGVIVTVYKREGETAQGFEATTNASGVFSFFDLEPGEWKVLADKPGYIPYKTTELVSPGEAISATYYVEKGSYSSYDVQVNADRSRKEVSRRTLTSTDIEKVPGSLGDPVLVVENLPGVARGAIGEIIVRGSGPNDTGIYVDGTNIPLIYHFGGLKSIFPAKLVDQVEFFPGNFSVAYGRAMGGILDLHLKKIAPDKFHGSIDVSVIDTSIYLETPISDNLSAGVAGRQSYIGTVIDALLPEDAGIGLINAPKYHDYQFFGNYRPAAKHEFRWLYLGSGDAFELLFEEPGFDAVNAGASNANVSSKTSIQRLNLEYRYTPSEFISNKLRVNLGREETSFSLFGNLGVDFSFDSISSRDALTLNISDSFKLDVGYDFELYTVSGDLTLPPPPREGEGTTSIDQGAALSTAFDNEAYVFIAPYIEAELKLGDVTLVPGLRTDYFDLTKSWSMDPRIVARYDAESWAVKGGAAVVHQAPFFPDIDDVFGNPDLELQRAYQYSLGGEWSPSENIKAEVTVFYKDMQNLVGRSKEVVTRNGIQEPEKLANNTVGRVFGAEAFVEHSFSNNFRGWLSYSLSRAERKDPGTRDYRLFDYDQTHILAVVGNYSLPQNWEIGFRWRYVTGNLNTPVVNSVFNSSKNAYTPIFGTVNSERLPSFHQLDLRVDKTWIFDTWKLSTYLSVINSYNRDNVDAETYNFDYKEKSNVTGLPLLPILGVKGEW